METPTPDARQRPLNRDFFATWFSPFLHPKPYQNANKGDLFSGDQINAVGCKCSGVEPKYAFCGLFFPKPVPGNPVKQPKSGPVENSLKYRFD